MTSDVGVGVGDVFGVRDGLGVWLGDVLVGLGVGEGDQELGVGVGWVDASDRVAGRLG